MHSKPVDTFTTGMEIEAQGAFYGDLAIAEVGGVKNPGVFAFGKGEIDFGDTFDVLF